MLSAIRGDVTSGEPEEAGLIAVMPSIHHLQHGFAGEVRPVVGCGERSLVAGQKINLVRSGMRCGLSLADDIVVLGEQICGAEAGVG